MQYVNYVLIAAYAYYVGFRRGVIRTDRIFAKAVSMRIEDAK